MEIKISQEELHRSYQEYLSSPEKFCEICASEMTERCVTLDCDINFIMIVYFTLSLKIITIR